MQDFWLVTEYLKNLDTSSPTVREGGNHWFRALKWVFFNWFVFCIDLGDISKALCAARRELNKVFYGVCFSIIGILHKYDTQFIIILSGRLFLSVLWQLLYLIFQWEQMFFVHHFCCRTTLRLLFVKLYHFKELFSSPSHDFPRVRVCDTSDWRRQGFPRCLTGDRPLCVRW